jgi:hypothetical protein
MARPTLEDLKARDEVLARLPFKWVEVPGTEAMDAWRRYRKTEGIYPVVLGEMDDLEVLADNLLDARLPSPPIEEVLARASALRHPQDLFVTQRQDYEDIRALILEQHIGDRPDPAPRKMFVSEADGKKRQLTGGEVVEALLREWEGPPIGEWPSEPPESPGLTVTGDDEGVFAKVYIALIPIDDWTTVPAHLRWGGWNVSHAPEFHVAALRSWRDRYGAELVGLSSNTINLRVARRPQTREEALALAREHYAYCTDVIDQNRGTVSALAAMLMDSDWWYFWWD